MSRSDADELAQTAERILTVDAKRVGGDAFLLSPELRGLLTARLSAFRDKHQSLSMKSGSRSGNAVLLKATMSALRERVRDGYNYLLALPTFRVPQDQKQSAFRAYGFEQGKLGGLERKQRVLALARLAVSVTPSVQPAACQYPSDLLQQLQDLLDVVSDAEPGAKIGNRSAATIERDKAFEELQRIVRRVRHFYCSCSDDVDASEELARVGLNPVRRSGQRKTKAENGVKPPEGPLPPINSTP